MSTIIGDGGNNTLPGTSGDDSISGLGGNDTLDGGGGNDTLDGGGGNSDAASYSSDTAGVNANLAAGTATGSLSGSDTLIGIEFLIGGSGNDTLTGDSGINSLSGGAGNDSLAGGANSDTLIGGAGDDTLDGGTQLITERVADAVDYSSDTAGVNANLATGTATGSLTGTDTLIDIEALIGGSGNDTLTGKSGGNGTTLTGGAGNDSLVGIGNGNGAAGGGDTTGVSYSTDTAGVNVNLATGLATGSLSGNDTLVGIRTANGGSGNDTVIGDSNNNILGGNAGNDSLDGGDGNDFLMGSAGDDTLIGGPGLDTGNYILDSGGMNIDLALGTATGSASGTDSLSGIENLSMGSGSDTLTGDANDNFFIGRAGNDTINGAAGDDTFIDGAGNDTLDGGANTDTVSYSNLTTGVNVNLAAGTTTGTDSGSDVLSNIENATGGSGSDTLTGDAGANSLVGGSGDDTLIGGDGNDTLDAGDGNDSLEGDSGTGNDSLRGGSGSDTLDGAAANDTLNGGADNDSLQGGDGNDVLYGDDVSGVTLVSASAAGVAANVQTGNVARFSPDGTKVIFEASSDNLVPGDTNGQNDIFVKNILTGDIDRVSTTSAGAQLTAASNAGIFMPDGNKVLFVSNATNLVAGDTNGRQDIFLKDLTTGAVTRVSTDSSGNQINGTSGAAMAVSADGTQIVFESAASNLSPGDTNTRTDIFVKDLVTGAVTLISADASGVVGDAASGVGNPFGLQTPLFSPDGSKVAFYSVATNLVPGDTNGVGDVFVKDIASGAITRISTAADGSEGNGIAGSLFSFSPDGTKISFDSEANNLVAGDANGKNDVFIKDLGTGAVTLVSTDAGGAQGDGRSLTGRFSPDGTKVAFASYSSNLVPNDTNVSFDLATEPTADDVYIKDLATGAITRISVDAGGLEQNIDSFSAFFSPDGSKLVFRSFATNLVLGTVTNTNFFVVSSTLQAGGNDTLDGGAGADRMEAGPGDDTYSVDDAGDQVIEGPNAGIDTVNTTLNTYTLTANVENLNFAGAGDVSEAGNVLDNQITGGAGNDTLDGGDGNDTLDGGDGNDSLEGDSGAGNDSLIGGNGNDTLDGAAGDDTLTGGAGGDTFKITALADLSSSGDHITDFGNGADLIDLSAIAGLSFVGTAAFTSVAGQVRYAFVGPNTEIQIDSDGNGTADQKIVLDNVNVNLVETSAGSHILRIPQTIGTAGNDTLSGSTGSDTMDGLAGNDSLSGNAGNDSLIGGEDGDTLLGGGGNDTLEGDSGAGNDSLDGGSGNDSLTAGDGNDTLIGGTGNDILDGGSGADSMSGGTGSDVFIVDNAADTVSETSVGDTDIVYTGLGAYTLGSNLEGLIYTGAAGFTGSGNTLANQIAGGAGGDTLSGLDGNDTLTGGVNNDTLTGGNGDDLLGGGAGNDALIGGAGNDTLAGDDVQTMTLVSSAADGSPSNNTAFVGDFSPDGSKILFASGGANLVPGDTNGATDIFLKNLATGAITRISVAADGTQANGSSNIAESMGSFSADGNKVVFSSFASNLVADDTNGFRDIFVKNLATGAVTLVSTAADGTLGDNAASVFPVLSPDGTKVAFGSLASNLVPGDVNGLSDIFIKDLTTGAVTRIGGDGTSRGPLFSPDGTKLAFQSLSSDLVAGDTNGAADVFVRDMTTGVITRVSVDALGAQGAGGSTSFVLTGPLAFSPDGTKIAFDTYTQFVPGDTLNNQDVYIKDLVTGAITLVSTTSETSGADSVMYGGFAADGSKLVFGSFASDLVPGDTNVDGAASGTPLFPGSASAGDVFIKDLTSGAITRLSVNAEGIQENDNFSKAIVSPDGHSVAFSSTGNNLFPGATFGGAFVVSLTPPATGIDTVSFSGDTAGVNASLATGTASGSLSGNDVLIGIENLTGGDGPDTLTGGSGNNVLDGATGADSLTGADGNDTFTGGADRDTIDGGNGDDSIDGGTGNDSLVGGAGIGDFANFASDSGGVNANLATGTASGSLSGNDTLSGIEDLEGGSGNDTLIGDTGTNTLWGNSGNDSLDGGSGIDDAVYYNDTAGVNANLATGTATGSLSGNDTLVGIENLKGGSGNDTLIGDANDNQLYGRIGNDSLDGGGGIDTANFLSDTVGVNANLATGTATGTASGNDTLVNFENLSGGTGNDTLIGDANANSFTNNMAGNDSMDGGGGVDAVNFGGDTAGVSANLLTGTASGFLTGNDTLAGIENLFGGSGNDTLTGDTGSNSIGGNGGNDSIAGGDGNDTLSGGAGADTIDGGAGDDSLFSNPGVDNDSLFGGAGNDTLRGGGGADTLDGGTGTTDMVDFSLGNFSVTVNLAAGTTSDSDTLININGAFGTPFADTLLGSDASNTLIGNDDNDSLSGAGGDDRLNGGNGDDTLDGGDGNDSLIAGGGDNDFLTGGAGDDTLDGTGTGVAVANYSSDPGSVVADLSAGSATDGSGGHDSLVNINAAIGSAFADTLIGGAGDNSFSGNDGADTIDGSGGFNILYYGFDPNAVSVDLAAGTATDGYGQTDHFVNIQGVTGSGGDDSLVGDAADNSLSGDPEDSAGGNDTLAGGDGNDTLEGRFGNDSLEGDSGTGNDSLVGGSGDDTLAGGAGDDTFLFTDLSDLSASGDHITDFGTGGDLIDLSSIFGLSFIGTAAFTGVAGQVRYAFAGPNTEIQIDSDGDGASDRKIVLDNIIGTLTETSLGSHILTSSFNDTLSGTSGDDSLNGFAGNDSVSGGDGNDTLVGGDGNDTLDGGDGNDSLEGDSGAGNDSLIGGSGSDTLDGAAGDDTLTGGDGGDTFKFSALADLSSSGDHITDFGMGADRIDLSGIAGLSFIGIAAFSGGAGQVRYAAVGPNTEIQIDSDGDSVSDRKIVLDNINLNLVETSSGSSVLALAPIIGTSGRDTLIGTSADDSISGLGGGDSLDGAAGNDTLDGGTVSDTLHGGPGDDSLIGDTGAFDLATYFDDTAGVNANLVTGIASGSLSGNDTLFKIKRLLGGSGNDTLVGSTANGGSVIEGAGGNDSMVGNTLSYSTDTAGVNANLATGLATGSLSGSDTLAGFANLSDGSGNDTLIGDNHNNVFFIRGGNDSIDGSVGTRDLIDYTDDTAGVNVNLATGTATGLLSGSDTLAGIEDVRGGLGSDTLIGNADGNWLMGWFSDFGNPDDSIDGGAGDDTLLGYGGNDTLIGGAGNDFLSNADGASVDDSTTGNGSLDGGAGDDTLYGQSGDDILNGGTGNDLLIGGADNDTLDGGDGNDTLDGFLGNDAVGGGAGDDLLLGNQGDDTVLGAGGNDTLDGGDGSDTAIFSGAWADYTINTVSGTTTVTDNRGGSPDGTDTVTNVENFQFSNGTFTAAQIVNDAPTAVADTVHAVEAGGVNNGTPGSDPSGNVLANDTDPDSGFGDTKAVQGVAAGTPSGPLATGVDGTIIGSFGSLVLNANGGYTYTLDNANASVQALNAGNHLTDTFTYTMRDAAGATSTATLAVTIDGANDAPSTPVDSDATANSVAENSANGTLVGVTASSTDVDGPFVHYSLTDDASGRFAIDTNTGVVTVANGSLLDFESATSHQITVQASDGTLSATQNFTIAIGDVVEGGVTINDDDNAHVLDGTSFGDTINGNGGNDTVNAGDGNDSASGGDGNDQLNAGSGNDSLSGGNGADALNGGAGDDSLEGDSGAGNDSLVGGIGDDTLTGGAGNDTLDGGDGSDTAIFSGAWADYTITVSGTTTVIDNRGGSPDGTDTVTNVETFQFSNGTFTAAQILNDAPTAVGDSANAVEAGGVSNGTPGTDPSGNVLTNDTDPDSGFGDTKAVQGVAAGTPGGPLTTGVGGAIDGSFGSLVLNANGGYTYTLDNANASVQALNSGNQLTDTFTYTMRDAAGATSTATLAVTIDGANDAPSTPVDADATANSVAEGAANGTLVGITASSTDVDGPFVHYSLTDDAGGRFAIDINTGVVTVANGTLLDFESATSHQITVRASDGTLNATQNFTIAIGDVVEGGVTINDDDNAHVLDGTAFGDTINGNGGNDTVNAGDGNDSVTGGDGNDSLDGGGDNDTLDGGNGNDSLEGDSGAGNDSLLGGAGQDSLVGLAGNDTLDGSADVDTMIGGTGNDAYFVDNSSDLVVENAGEGTDTANTTLNAYTLAANVENLNFIGSGDFTGSGNADGNAIAGGTGNDSLSGLGGNDVLLGGDGNDRADGNDGDDSISGDAANDTLTGGAGNDTLDGGAGTDAVGYSSEANAVFVDLSTGTAVGVSSGSDVLIGIESVIGSSPGNDTLIGDSAANRLTGNQGNDTLIGGDGNDTLFGDVASNGFGNGNDTLDGGVGADSLVGGTGNDVYIADNAGDAILENAGEGTDSVLTTLNVYTLAANVENLAFAGSGNFSASGNVSDNAIVGGTGDDTLLGLDGNDGLGGGAGNDSILGGNGNDTVLGGDGNDTIRGNDGTDSLDGGDGNDTFAGGAGSDTMDGGAGTDVADFTLANASIEADLSSGTAFSIFDGSTDTLLNIENLNGSGFDDALTGDSGANAIFGNDGNDTLKGNNGADTLDGGNGNDVAIYSGAWADYTVNTVSGTTTLTDNRGGSPDGTDTVTNVENFQFSNGTFAAADIANDAPTDIGLSGTAVNENALNGTVVGSLSRADTDEGLSDTATYSLTDNAGGRFAISGANLTVANGSLLDYETSTSHSVTVRVTDSHGAFFDKTFAIGLNDQNDNAPVFDSGTTASTPENVSTATVVYDANAHDNDGTSANNTIGYSLTGADASALSINGATGEVRFLSSPDFEAPADLGGNNVYDIVVHANDGTHDVTQGVTITVTDLAEGAGNDTLSGGSGNDTLDGLAGNDSISGNDGNDTLDGGDDSDTLDGGNGDDSLEGDSGAGNDSLSGGAGTDTLAGNAGNDTLSGGAGNDSLDGGDGSDTAIYSGAWADYTITGIGPFTLTDNRGGSPDGTDTVANVENFQFSNGTFTAAQILNDAPTAVADTVHAVEAGGVNNGTPGTNPSGNVLTNDTDPDSGLGDTKSVQGVASGTPGGPLTTGVGGPTIGTFGSLVLNANGGYTYTLDNANASVQALNSGNHLTDTFTYTMRDAAGAASTATLAVTIDGANDAPSTPVDLDATANSVDEGVANGTPVGITASSTDVDGPFVHYSLTDNAGGRFAIDINTGVVTVANGTLLDFETATSHQITVQASDGTLNATQNFTIAIGDVAEGGVPGETLDGGGGNDTLAGGVGDDSVSGGDGGDSLDGGAGGDTVVAGNGDDSVSGGSGGDSIDAGDGEDTVGGDEGNDIVFGWGGSDFLDGGDGNDTLNGGDGNDSLEGDSGTGDDSLVGGDGNDTLDGGTGNDTLDGGAGADSLVGGDGDDTYLVDDGLDVISEATGGSHGVDSVRTSLLSYTLGGGLENLAYTGAGDFNGTGNRLNNFMTGNTGNDTLAGLDGNDTLDGGAGTDSMIGGAGNDVYYVDNASDAVSELAGDGVDTENVTAAGAYTLAANVENMIATGLGDFALTGNSDVNTIAGGQGNDTLYAAGGADELVGNGGDDTYLVDDASVSINETKGIDTVLTSLSSYTLESGVENLAYTQADWVTAGSGDFTGTGKGSDNKIIGGTGNDSLSGLGGNDTLEGNGGNDTLDGGYGADSLEGDSGSGNDLLLGGDGSDTLEGGAGNDTMTGGAGADRLVFTAADGPSGGAVLGEITDFSAAGGDRIDLTFDAIVGGPVDSFSFIGSGAFTGVAGQLHYVINGSGGVNVEGDTDGDGVADFSFVVDGVTSLAAGAFISPGVDTDQLSYTLGPADESLTYTGTGDFAGTGNALHNAITGNVGDDTLTGLGHGDTLDGGSGEDSLIGGRGSDTYIVDSPSDVIVENPGEGTDTELVTAPGTYTLADNVEKMTFTGTGDFSGIGNDAANTITGGGGNDTLYGGGGLDKLVGGLGDDTFLVDTAGERVSGGDGNDTVLTTLSDYTLGFNVDNLSFKLADWVSAATADSTGTGNNSANAITGGSGNDSLSGRKGNDTLDGGAGNDTMSGGQGADRFVFSQTDAPTGGATLGEITDFSHAQADKIDVSGIDAVSGVPGSTFGFIGSGAFTGTAGQLHYVINGGGGVNVEGDTNGDGVADFSVQVDGVASLVAADFIL